MNKTERYFAAFCVFSYAILFIDKVLRGHVGAIDLYGIMVCVSFIRVAIWMTEERERQG